MNLSFFILVFLGSGIGGCLRFSISLFFKTIGTTGFPFGTLVANFLSCLLAAFLISKDMSQSPSTYSWHLLLVVGVCGGFSTFSTFGVETWELIAEGKGSLALVYVATSMILSLFAMWLFLRN